MVACTDDTESILPSGPTLQLNIKTAGIETRGIIESATLPDGHSIGLTLTDDGGTTYDNISYNNIKATASTGATPQTWSLASAVNLSSTDGTLYGYYPYSNSVSDITQIPVTSGDTDYMYATPVTGLDDGNYNASVTMNHALAAIRLKIVKGTYTGAGSVTSVSIKGDNIATSGVLNAMTGALLSQAGVGTAITYNSAFTLSTTAKQIDQIIVPVTNSSAAPTFSITLDGSEYTATPSSVKFEQGSIYEYTLTIDSKGISLSDVNVGDWGYNSSGNPVIEAGYNIILTGDMDNIAINSKMNNDGSVSISAVPMIEDHFVVYGSPNDNARVIQQLDKETGIRKFTVSDIKAEVTINLNGIFENPADDVILSTFEFDASGENTIVSSFHTISAGSGTPTPSYDITKISCIWVDGVEITPAKTYTLSAGVHVIGYKLNDPTTIDGPMFCSLSKLKETIIPATITSLHKYALGHPSGLSCIVVDGDNPVYDSRENCNAVIEKATNKLLFGSAGISTISATVTSIGDNAFYNCTGLTNVTIGSGVTSIGNGAFYNCTGLTNVTIGSGVTSIGTYAFYSCSGLTNITSLATTAPTIQSNTFYSVKSSGTLIVPSGCAAAYSTWMGTGNYYLGSYKWLCLEEGNYTITDGIVYSTDKRTLIKCLTDKIGSVTIPNTVTSIGNSAFSDCKGLTDITIPNSVTSIGSSAFSGCSGLMSVKSLATTAPTIQYDTFYSVKSSGTLIVPSGCAAAYSTWMGTDAFYLGKYNWVCLEENNYTIVDDIIYSSDMKTLLKCPIDKTGSFIIPNTVTSIGSGALANCTGLTSITIPNSVTSIGDNAFQNCSGLTDITIPNSVTSIGSSAFSGCSGLTNIKISEGVTSIGSHVFYNCKGLTDITIPEGVTSIGNYAFSGCTGLTSIISKATTVPTISNYTFYSVKSSGTLIVPSGCAAAYSTWMGTDAFYLGKYNWVCLEENNYTIVDDIIYSSDMKTLLKCPIDKTGSFIIPNTVTSIGSGALANCTGLTSITIPNSVTSIGERAFYQCTGITNITIPSSVTSIGSRAFYNCYKLTSVTIGSGVTSIGTYAFYSCSALTNITSLATTAPTIQRDTFLGIKSGGTLYVPSGRTTAYSTWMGTGNYYLGKYNWTLVESTE